jgi:RNA polymerase sigma-70 factor (ECF subfamily)
VASERSRARLVFAPGFHDALVEDLTMDEAEFQRVYRTFGRPIWSYVFRVLGNHSDADDLLQDTFCRYLRAPLVDKDDSEVRAYLFRIASNVLTDLLRRSKRQKSRSHQAAAEDSSRGIPDESVRLDVARAFERLKPQERSLLWLAYVEGSGHRDIAAALGVKEKSVKVLLFRARRKLAGLLEARGLARRG